MIKKLTNKKIKEIFIQLHKQFDIIHKLNKSQELSKKIDNVDILLTNLLLELGGKDMLYEYWTKIGYI